MANIRLILFSIFIFIFGITLTYFTVDYHSQLPINCISPQVQTGFNIILMLSIMMINIPVVQLVCLKGCGCTQTTIWYRWIIISILLLLIAAGSTVLNGLSDSKCKNDNVKTYMLTLIISSVTVLIFIIGFSIYEQKRKSSKGVSERSEVGEESEGSEVQHLPSFPQSSFPLPPVSLPSHP